MANRRAIVLSLLFLAAMAGLLWVSQQEPLPVDAEAVSERNDAREQQIEREQALRDSLPELKKRAAELRQQLAAEDAERKLRGQ